MKIVKKIWLWVFEFKLKRVADDKKVEFLAKQLLEELELQGYTLKSTDDIYGIDINIYRNSGFGANRCEVLNGLSKWEIDCGTYEPKWEDK
ncbi:MAG: hypothetical protein H6Q69_3354 [Firmicutes bacterium]|nr:hypothetical protein [Bacillota bacterium]